MGTDVLALDILRGRDHGLHTYKNYLELCTKTSIQSWNDLRPFINPEVNGIKNNFILKKKSEKFSGEYMNLILIIRVMANLAQINVKLC